MLHVSLAPAKMLSSTKAAGLHWLFLQGITLTSTLCSPNHDNFQLNISFCVFSLIFRLAHRRRLGDIIPAQLQLNISSLETIGSHWELRNMTVVLSFKTNPPGADLIGYTVIIILSLGSLRTKFYLNNIAL